MAWYQGTGANIPDMHAFKGRGHCKLLGLVVYYIPASSGNEIQQLGLLESKVVRHRTFLAGDRGWPF